MKDRDKVLNGVLITTLALSGCKGTSASKDVNAMVTPTPTASPMPDFGATQDLLNARIISQETAMAEILAKIPTEVPTVTATSTQEATVATTPEGVLVSGAIEKFNIFEVEDNVNGWTIKWTDIAQKDRGDGKSFEEWAKATYPEWIQVKPELWPTAANVPNPLVPEFKTSDGAEIPDEGERDFCQVVEGEKCTNVVAAGHYMLYTGDGEIDGLWKSEDGKGNALLIINVGDTDFRPTGTFLQGWRSTGRYLNGDTLPIGINALISSADNNMLNLKSVLNPNEGLPNGGSNCSNRNGCEAVVNTVVIVSGGAPLLIAESKVTK
jgi:hypothetical protein